MNREVEERIVAMYFDNKDFEKNAQTTINTLGQLKSGLNLEESASKGIGLFEKLGKTLNFEKANKSLSSMKTKLGGMSGALGKLFKIGSAPLREAENAINSLNGYIGKVFGIDLAGKIVSGVENALRSLTVAPIGAGWDQYQSKMDSVKTIMSSTGESIEVVEYHLQNMTDYANKTIYSLTDMTSNLGKFTNNGIELGRATRAMEGIANATADAGQGAQQASMAMYNLSQAMGVGKMTTIDWKSLENANVATQKLKNTFLEMAAANGKLKKEVKEVNGEMESHFYLETDENGKKLKERIELTAANFREYLSKGWLDKETMLRTFEIYSGEGIDEDVLRSWGIKDDDTIKYLLELGQQALESATQVRTFSKMMDALKESVQSGWAQSFEIIFGNMEEGTQLWTQMNDKIDSILSKATKNRNDILKKWAEMTETGEYWTRDKNNNHVRTGIEGGREILINSVFEMMDVIQNFSSMVSEAFSNVFGKLDAKALFNITLGFRNLVNTARDWLGSVKNFDSRISKIQRALKGVFSIAKAGINIFKSIIDLGARLIKPVIDPLLNALAKLGSFFNGLGDMNVGQIFSKIGQGFQLLFGKIKNFFTKTNGATESPFGNWIKNAFTGLKDIVGGWMSDIGLGGVWDSVTQWFEGVKTTLSEGINSVKSWWERSEFGKFFTGIFEEVTGWFKAPEGGESGFAIFIRNTKIGLVNAWNSLITWPGWDAIGSFFGDIWGWIREKAGGVIGWFTASEDGGESGFANFIRTTKIAISNAWNSLVTWPGWDAIGSFFGDIWGWISEKAGGVINWFTGAEDGTESGFANFIRTTKIAISNAWNSLATWPGWDAVGSFFGDIWGWIREKAGGVINWFTGAEDGTESGFATFISNTKIAISNAWNRLTTWEGWAKIGSFFGDIWSWLTGQTGMAVDPSGKAQDDSGSATRFANFISEAKIAISNAWNRLTTWEGWSSIGSFFGNIWGWISDKAGGVISAVDQAIEGSDSGFANFLRNVKIAISNAWISISGWEGWAKIGKFFGNIKDWIAEKASMAIDWFKTPADGSESGFANFIRTTKIAISNAWNSLVTWPGWQEIGKFFSDIFSWISDFVTGGGNGNQSTVGAEVTAQQTEQSVGVIERIITAIGGFMEKVEGVMTKITGSEELGKFLKAFGDFFRGLVSLLTEVLSGLGKMMQGDLSFDNWKVFIIPGIIAIVTSLFNFFNNKFLSGIGVQNLAQQFIEVAGGLFLLATAVGILSAIDQTKMWYAVGAIAVLGAVFAAIVALMTKLHEAGQQKAEETSTERILKSLINTVGKIGMVAVAMALLPGIIKSIGELQNGLGGKDVLDVLLGLSALIATISLVFGIIQKATGNNGLDPKATAMSAFSLVAGIAIIVTGMEALLGLMGGTANLLGGKENVKDTVQLLRDGGEIFAAIGEGIGRFIYAIGGGMTLQDTDTAVRQLDSIGEAAKMFDIEKISGISRMMTLISQLTENSHAYDTNKLKNFAEAMSEMGSGIYEIAGYIQEMEGPFSELHNPESIMFQRLEGFVKFGNELGSMLVAFTNAHIGDVLTRLHELATVENSQKLVNDLQVLMNALGTLNMPDQGIQFDGLSIATRLVEAIQTGLTDTKLPKFDATSIIDDICEAIGIGSSAIALYVHDMVQKGLNASGTGEGGEGYELPGSYNSAMDFFNKFLGEDGTVKTLNFDSITNQLTGEGGLLSIFNDFENKLPSMEDILGKKGLLNFTKEDGTPIDFVGTIQEHLNSLGDTLNEMDPFTVTITPVFDYTNLTAENLLAELGMQSVPLAVGVNAEKMQVDFTGLESQLNLEGIRSRLSEVSANVSTYGANTVVAIGNLASHIDGIASAVASIRLYLDTGALVGGLTPYIDAAIYRRSWFTSRTGTSLNSGGGSRSSMANAVR